MSYSTLVYVVHQLAILYSILLTCWSLRAFTSLRRTTFVDLFSCLYQSPDDTYFCFV